MTKSPNGMDGKGGHKFKKSHGPLMRDTPEKEESKLDSKLVSGHSTFKAEGGLILNSLPPSATHTKNT